MKKVESPKYTELTSTVKSENYSNDNAYDLEHKFLLKQKELQKRIKDFGKRLKEFKESIEEELNKNRV